MYGDLLSPGMAAVVLAAYALVPIGLAAIVLSRSATPDRGGGGPEWGSAAQVVVGRVS